MKKLFPYLLFIVPIFGLQGCKKDYLQGDSSILIGNWTWTYSSYTSTCDKSNTEAYKIYPSQTLTFSIQIEYNANIRFYQNDSLLNAGKMKVGIEKVVNNSVSFQIKVNNNPYRTFIGFTDGKVMQFYNSFPFKEEANSCEQYYNYFSKDL